MEPPADARAAVLEIVELVGAAADLGLAIEPTLEAALGRLAATLGARLGAVYVKEPTTGSLVLRAHLLTGEGEPSAPAPAIRPQGQPRLVAALLGGRHAEAADGPNVADELAGVGLGGGLLVPARAGGQTVGALGLGLAPARTLAPDEREAVRAAAQVLALGLRNNQLFAGLQDRARELDRQVRQLVALTEVARGVARSLDEGEAHRTIAAEARRLVRADAAVLLLLGPDGLRPVAAEGRDLAAVPPAAGRLADVAAGGGPLRLGREAAVPIPSADGRRGAVAGVIALSRASGDPFDEDDLERLGGLAEQATVALANARLLADLRREQAERRSLAAALVLAQEQERRRVAEDLHDGPVQELVGLGLMLDALGTDLRRESPAVADEVEAAAASARDSVRALRRAIFDLHPMALEELGFSAATRALVQRLEWRGVQVALDVAAADALSETHRTVAFRIVQEAVANVIRHAEPTRVAITAHAEADRVVLEVVDDGRGFDPARDRPRIEEGHLGLAAVEERAALVGGEVTIDSAQGRGTTLRLVLPAPAGGAGQPGGGEASRSSAAARAASSAKRSSTTS